MALFGIVGFALLLGSGNPHVQYAGVFLGAMGIYPCIPNTISWTANNTEGVYKRGIALGFVIGWGNLNGKMRFFRPMVNTNTTRHCFVQHLSRRRQATV
jgi:hypothetical protein